MLSDIEIGLSIFGATLVTFLLILAQVLSQQDTPIEQPVDGPRGQYYTGKEYDA